VDDGLEKRRLANDHGQFLANDIYFGDTQLMDWKNDNWQTIMDSFWRTILFWRHEIGNRMTAENRTEQQKKRNRTAEKKTPSAPEFQQSMP